MSLKKTITVVASVAVFVTSLYFLPPNSKPTGSKPAEAQLGGYDIYHSLEKIVAVQLNRERGSGENQHKFSYELNPEINRDHIRNLSRCIVRVDVDTLYEEDGKIQNGGGYGSGILLEKNYLLTACHLANSGNYADPQLATPSPPRKMIKSECNAIIDKKKYALEKVVEDAYWDFSLMKFKASPILSKNEKYRFKLGKSSELQYGDFVYVVGNGNNQGIDFRVTRITKPVEEDGFFCVSMANLAHGDSGGYVFAVKNGIPELVGMLNELRGDAPTEGVIIGTAYGYAIGIDPIIEKIRAYNPKIIGEWESMK